jgi:subtilisin family serine protease
MPNPTTHSGCSHTPPQSFPARVCARVLACAVGLILLGGGPAVTRADSLPAHASGEVLVKWAPSVDAVESDDARGQVAGLTVQRFRHIGWERLRIDPTMDVSAALQRLRRHRGVLAAEPNYERHIDATVPNDTGFSLQWALQNTGQTVNGSAGTPGADISAATAWDLRTTSPGVVLAIVDTGVVATNADLEANVVGGWNFIAGTSNVTDDNGHGTFVAAIIGGKGNDRHGVAGLTWSAQLMPLKACDATGTCTVANIVSAIQYATAQGAQIINASLSGPAFSQIEKDAIDAFTGLFVAAAGNAGSNNDVLPVYPACYASANLIAVAATDQNDGLAGFSNFGPSCVPLAAPGVNITSDDYLSGGLAVGNGTSFAAPMVSGVAALMKAQEPNRTTAEVRSAIVGTVDVKASLAGRVGSGGRLNAHAAVAAILPLAPSGLTGRAAGASRVDLTWVDHSAGETGEEIQRQVGTSPYVSLTTIAAQGTSFTDTAPVEGRSNTYRVRAVNSGGGSEFSNAVAVPIPPAAPSALNAGAGASSVSLTWINNSTAATAYEVHRRSGSDTYSLVGTTAASITSYTDGGLAVGTAYTYKVRAVGATGPSDFTAEVSATPQAGGSSSGGGGGGGGGCFIATAAFGSPLAPEVESLRVLRDRYLVTNAPGRLFVAGYYRISPPLAQAIAGDERLRAVARFALRPIVAWAHLVLLAPALTLGLSGIAPPLFLLLITCVGFRRRSRGPRDRES